MTESRMNVQPKSRRLAAWLCAVFMGITALAPVGAEEDLALDTMEVEEGIALNDEEAEFASYDTFEAEEDIAFSMGQITDVRNAFDLQGKTWEGLAAFTWTVHVPGAESITLHFGAAQLTGAYDKVVLENLHGERTTFTGSELNHRSATVSGDSLSVTMFLEAGSQSQLELERIAKNDADDLTLQAQTNEGTEEVSMALRQVTGRAIQQVEYTLKNDQGEVVDSVTTSALSYEKKNLPQGEYTVSAKITDGVNTAFMGDQSVLAQAPVAKAAFSFLAVTHVPTVQVGQSVEAVFRADSPVGGVVYYYVYRLYNSAGIMLAEAVTQSPSHTFQIPQEGAYVIQGTAFDGHSFAFTYTNWFLCETRRPLSVALQVDPFHATGETMTVKPTVLTGGPIKHLAVLLFNTQFQTVQRWDFSAGEGQITLPAVPASYYLYVWATDGYSQATAGSNWFVVYRPDLRQEVTLTTLTPVVKQPVWFNIATVSGSPVWSRMQVRKPDGTVLDQSTSSALHYSWTPTETGDYVFEVISSDGVQTITNRVDFHVRQKGVYRALVIGMGYTNEPRPLPGTLLDASSVIEAFRHVTTTVPTFATMRKLEEPNRAAIEDAIQDTFRGATEDDISVFYYSGHGAQNGSLVTTDQLYANRYITPLQLRQMLDQIPGTKVVLVDACHSGALIGKNSDGQSPSQQFVNNFTSAFRGTSKSLVSSNYYVITSSHSSELSYEANIYSEGQHRKSGVFTHCLLKGIGYNNVTQRPLDSKKANANNDGFVTMEELYNYVSKEAPRLATQSTQYHIPDPKFVFVEDKK